MLFSNHLWKYFLDGKEFDTKFSKTKLNSKENSRESTKVLDTGNKCNCNYNRFTSNIKKNTQVYKNSSAISGECDNDRSVSSKNR